MGGLQCTLLPSGKDPEFRYKSYGKETKLNWIELLAYLVQIRGNFKGIKTDLDKLVKSLQEARNGGTTKDMVLPYYLEAYTAVLAVS